MSEKWTTEEILHFLDIYKKYDVLWNTQSTEYREKHSRELALRGILEELDMKGLTLDIIRNKIKMIKTVYSQERNKITKSKLSATDNQDIYKPKLAWFGKADNFLSDVISTQGRRKIEVTKTENDEDDSEEIDLDENAMYFGQEEKKSFQKPTNKTSIKKNLARKMPVSTKFLTKLDTRKRNNVDMVTNALSNKQKNIADCTNKEEDEFDHFGKYIAAQMRQLPILNALHCQEQVLNIITQERIATIQQAELEASGSQTHWNETQAEFN